MLLLNSGIIIKNFERVQFWFGRSHVFLQFFANQSRRIIIHSQLLLEINQNLVKIHLICRRQRQGLILLFHFQMKIRFHLVDLSAPAEIRGLTFRQGKLIFYTVFVLFTPFSEETLDDNSLDEFDKERRKSGPRGQNSMT